MKKLYARPYLVREVFSPQEYMAVCEYYLDGVDPINNASITSSTKFWPDSNQDGFINGSDYYKHATYQTDGSGWGSAETLVKAWWAVGNSEAESIYNASDPMAQFRTLQSEGKAGYVDAVVSPKNNHYYAGSVTMKKNHS